MNRVTIGIICLGLLPVLAGCGQPSKRTPTASPTSSATGDTTGTVTQPSATSVKASATPAVSKDKALGSIFGTLFSSGALSAASNPAADPANLPPGDPALKQYVLKEGEFPAGYAGYNEFSSLVPDGLSTAGKIDVAASMVMRGDLTADDPSGVGVLMSMAMKPQDVQSLGEAFDTAQGLTDQNLQDSVSGAIGTLGGVKLTDARVLDAPGLGDGAFGMSFSMNLDQIAEAFAGEGDATPIPNLNMRLYIFARGDYIGGIIDMSFGSGAAPVDDLALARAVDSKLASAP